MSDDRAAAQGRGYGHPKAGSGQTAYELDNAMRQAQDAGMMEAQLAALMGHREFCVAEAKAASAAQANTDDDTPVAAQSNDNATHQRAPQVASWIEGEAERIAYEAAINATAPTDEDLVPEGAIRISDMAEDETAYEAETAAAIQASLAIDNDVAPNVGSDNGRSEEQVLILQRLHRRVAHQGLIQFHQDLICQNILILKCQHCDFGFTSFSRCAAVRCWKCHGQFCG